MPAGHVKSAFWGGGGVGPGVVADALTHQIPLQVVLQDSWLLHTDDVVEQYSPQDKKQHAALDTLFTWSNTSRTSINGIL